ncbi:hypothetical protein [Mariniblastus fucicola]|nr:hypothetical protein [Mariniblastus fucicola]
MNMKITRRLAMTSFALVTLASLPAVSFAQSADSGLEKQPATQEQTEIGLEGNCPVCFIKHGKWVKGSKEHAASFDGVTYLFPSEKVKEVFEENPIAYVPAFGGDCTVCFVNSGKRVPGKIEFATVSNERLFLFPGDKPLKAFQESPEKYADVDIAQDGNCIVCKVKAGKDVPGDKKFTAVHNGLRYLFPSDRERQAFVASPEKFLAATETASDKTAKTSAIRIQGRAACAACEFGVTAINSPDQLGFAVTTDDGRVFVIEDVHTRWPQLYKDRYDGNRVAVSGEVIKTEGKFTWINPEYVKPL